MIRPLCLALALALASPSALAQSIADEADTHFQQGAEAYDSFNYEEALLHFMQSNRLSPNPITAGNVGHTYVALKKFPEAYRWYALALRLSEGENDSIRDAMAAIENRVVLIELSSNPSSATVYIDQRSLGAVATTPATIAVPRGDYDLIFEAEGYKPFVVEDVEADQLGERIDVEAELEVILAQFEITGTEGAVVRLEDSDEPLGTVPFTANLAPGPTVLVAELEGYQEERLLVSPTLDEVRTVTAELEPVTGQVEVVATQRGARVDVDGELVGYTPVVANVPTGAREVRVSLDGYQSYTTEIDVVEGERLTIDAPLLRIQQVVTGSGVAESILDAPASIVVITAEEIEQRGYDNLAELLKDVPGFDAMTTNGITYQNNFQRGYRTPWTQRTLLIVDGRVDNNLWTHMAHISRQYPMTMIERVEILYGPASAIWGPNAFNGIINIVTKEGEQDTFNANVRTGYGTWDTRVVDGTITGGAGKVRYSFSGRYFGSDEANLCGEWGHTNCSDFKDPDVWGAFADPGDEDNDPLQTNGVVFSDGWADPTDDWGVHGAVGTEGFEIGGFAWNRREGWAAYYPTDKVHPGVEWGYMSTQLYAKFTRDVTDALTVSGQGGWRESRVLGDYAENFDGFLSFTNWHSRSNAQNAFINLEYRPIEIFTATGGIKFQHNNLTKAYDVPGYYGAFSSVELDEKFVDRDGDGEADVPLDEQTETTDGDYIFGPDADLGYFRPGPETANRMPSENMQPTDDIGAFVQLIADVAPFRFNTGIRVDHNSFYHRPLFADPDDFQVPDPDDPTSTIARNAVSVNPRASAIAKVGDGGAIKLLYGEAFQEPAPVLVWGGFSGRNSNEDLIPEKARNVELVGIWRTARFTNEISTYAAFYERVITEAAVNAGTRRAIGVEYRGSVLIPNPIPESSDISGYLNYTYTDVVSSQRFDFENGVFVDANNPVALGDIAPHKINFGVNLPITRVLNVNNRFNYVSSRTPYVSNALRQGDFTFDPYFLWNAHVRLGPDAFKLGLQINNITAADYLIPGGETASAGNDFDNTSLGFHNSAIPTPGRSFLLTGRFKL